MQQNPRRPYAKPMPDNAPVRPPRAFFFEANEDYCQLGLVGSYVPRASDPVCSLHISSKMTGMMRGPRSRESGAVTGVTTPLDVIARRVSAASLLGVPRPSGRGGACPRGRSAAAQRRRRVDVKGSSGREAATGECLVEGRRGTQERVSEAAAPKSWASKTRRRVDVGSTRPLGRAGGRPEGVDVAPMEAPGEVGGTRGRRAWRDEACGPPA